MLNKDTCKMCFSKREFPWGDDLTVEASKQRIYCMAKLYGDKRNEVFIMMSDKPPIDCPYRLEHLLNEETNSNS
jgi:uncharacterized Zn-finger protein